MLSWMFTLFTLCAVSLPASATLMTYNMQFSDPVGVVTGGSAVLTVDLPGTAGVDTCGVLYGCNSPPPFSVIVSFVGTVNGVVFNSSTDLLKVPQYVSISYSASELTSGAFNIISTEGSIVRVLLTDTQNITYWDWLNPGAGRPSGDGIITISKSTSSVSAPATLLLISLGLAGLVLSMRTTNQRG